MISRTLKDFFFLHVRSTAPEQTFLECMQTHPFQQAEQVEGLQDIEVTGTELLAHEQHQGCAMLHRESL